MAILLKSSNVIESLMPNLLKRCNDLLSRKIIPTMHVFLVGNNPASEVYVKNKKKFCENVGAICIVKRFPEDIAAQSFKSELLASSQDSRVNGIFVQLPIPKHLEILPIDKIIPPQKDVDGFHPENIFGIFSGAKDNTYLQPCTPKGTLTLLKHYGIKLEGSNIIIVGRSKIVGKPLSMLLTNQNSTVTLAHSKTKNLSELTKNADIVIAAIGRANYLDSSFFRATKDQVVIDVGMNKDSDGKLVGDVNLSSVEPFVAAITPVPGGIGPMTVATLIENLITATEIQN